MKSKKRLFVKFVIGFLIFGSIGFFVANSFLEKEKLLDVKFNLMNIANERTEDLEEFLRERERLFDELKGEKIFVDLLEIPMQDERYNTTLSEVLREMDSPLISSIGVMNTSGIIIAHTNNKNIGKNFKVHHDFEEVLKGEKNYYLHDHGDLNDVRLAITNPLRNEAGEIVGVLGMEVSWKKLKTFVDFPEDVEDGVEAYLIDSKLFLLTPSRFLKGENKGVFTQVVNTENVERCFDESIGGEPVISFLNYRGVEVFGVNKKILGGKMCLLVEVEKFFVGEKTPAGIYTRAGVKYLRSHTDGYWNNNLDNLPLF